MTQIHKTIVDMIIERNEPIGVMEIIIECGEPHSAAWLAIREMLDSGQLVEAPSYCVYPRGWRPIQ